MSYEVIGAEDPGQSKIFWREGSWVDERAELARFRLCFCRKWKVHASRLSDLNRRPTVYKTVALPLS